MIKLSIPPPVRRRIKSPYKWLRRRIKSPYKWLRSLRLRRHLFGLSRDRRVFSMSVTMDRFGDFTIAYRPGTSDESVLGHSFDRDIFFPGVPEYVPGPGHVILDVGAHIGTFSVLAASKAPGGRVLAIEPCADSYRLLRYNAMLNHPREIEPIRLALSDAGGRARLYYDEQGNWGHSIAARLSDRGEDVPTASLEYIFKSYNIDKFDFMKLNCEGAEFRILLGAPAEVLGRIGTILCLYHSDLVDHDIENLNEYLNKCGFTTTLRNQAGRRGWLVALNSCPSR